MRLLRLRITSFAAIRNVDIEFGPGLNVMYGPNDLGKSTVVAAIRLGLLLPHNSTHCEQYVGWTGGDDPIVEMTFQTEAQRIWRVRKQFGKSGSSLLQESKNGQDFDDVERGRKVDGKLREILRWGIPEPGGSGGAKGLPTSFLATALLSPQSDVSAVLRDSLQDDPTVSGKEQIAAALQAVAQDPLFVALLRNTQAQRDKAYTDKGAKKTAKGSVFKDAAERLNETRDEKEKLHQIVTDSEGAERHLRELTDRRADKQATLAGALALVENLETLASQATCRSVAAEQVRLAEEQVQRIRKTGADVDSAERKRADLAQKSTKAEEALASARSQKGQADADLEAAEETVRAEGSDPGVTDMLARQDLDLRKATAQQAAGEAQLRIDTAIAAQKLIDAAGAAERELKDLQGKANSAAESFVKATASAAATEDGLRRCDILERALDVQSADKQIADAQANVDKETTLRSRLEIISGERQVLTEQRSAITVPPHGTLVPMRRLLTELAAARGALDVGFVVTLTPKGSLDLRVHKDGGQVEAKSTAKPLEIEANAEIEIVIGDVATVNVRGGRREAQEKAKALENDWGQDVEPHLVAAGVRDLDGLDGKIAECRELDAGIKARDAEGESLRAQIASLAGAAEALREAANRAATSRAALGDIRFETLATDLKALGADPITGLRKRRQQLLKEAEAERKVANDAANAQTLADERVRQSQVILEAAISSRDSALEGFPEGVGTALTAARGALAASVAEKERVAAELASLERKIAERKDRIDTILGDARAMAAKASIAVDEAQANLTMAMTAHASHEGQLIELRKLRDAENIAEAEKKLLEATASHAGLPVPDRVLADDELGAAQKAMAALRLDLEGIEREIHRAQGALEQVGGAVARERLHDATEAFELAERHEREIEAEYEAWKLLLDQMKDADAAQASNLGQALVPAIADRFQALTQRRYQTVQLTAQLATEGIVVSGTLRSTDHISVGTREQLSTLYRLSLAEYLSTAIVLDDQLVQSDDSRMDWFRGLLAEKARSFQIVVFTCRPGDYLPASAFVPAGSAVHADTDGGFTRAVDLGRALHRR